jgi:hypothetical protein
MNPIPEGPTPAQLQEFYECDTFPRLVEWHEKYTPWANKNWIMTILERYDIENFKKTISKEEYV